MHSSINIAGNAKMIEVLKAELICEAADVMRASISQNGREDLIDTLSATVLLSYILARRCGISFHELESDILEKTQAGIRDEHKLESSYKDLSLLKKHFESRNTRGFGQDKKRRI